MNESCKKICDWMIVGKKQENNILEALLQQNMQELAIDYMGHYSHFLDKNLFLFAIHNNNDNFMQEALLKKAFD